MLHNTATLLGLLEKPMPLQPNEIKAIVKQRGWTFVDLAARWGHSVFYMSRLVNQPHTRPPAYDDAFRGLPLRADIHVDREPRHRRKKKAGQLWSRAQMFPTGRLFVAIDNKVFDEGVQVAVEAFEGGGPGPEQVHFTLVETGEAVSLEADVVLNHFQDLGLDLER
jgi:hypothetical protein